MFCCETCWKIYYYNFDFNVKSVLNYLILPNSLVFASEMFSFSLKSQGCEHFEREGVGGGDVTGETLGAEVAAAFACRTKRKLAASLSTTATGTTRRRSPFLDCLPTFRKVITHMIKLRSFSKYRN
jgi:hypothetical protein